MSGQGLVGLLLLALVATTLWFNTAPPALPDGSQPVTTKHEYHWTPVPRGVDGTVVVSEDGGAELGRWYLDGGQLYEPPGGTNRAHAVLIRQLNFIESGWDVGTWAGYFKGAEPGGAGRFQPGVRISPVRVFFGIAALDAVASQDLGGVGVSVYPPTRLGAWWRHWGVGGWYCAPFDGGDPSVCVGLTFSTRD